VVTIHPEKAHVGAVGEQRAVLDLGADRHQVERLQLLTDLDDALGIAD
jgi:hypothetical protein